MNALRGSLTGSLMARRLAALRDVDARVHGALHEAMPSLSDAVVDEAQGAALVDLLAQIATEAPDAALVLARRLANEPQTAANVHALRKWAVHGLQLHARDPKRQLSYFQWRDPQVFADQRTELDSAHLLARRDALLHYLGGFAVFTASSGVGVELHEPQDLRLPQPAATMSGDVIRMPRRCEGIVPADRDALYRATVAHIAAHLKFSPLARAAGNRRPMLQAMTALIEDARVERLMVRQYPGLRTLWGRFHTATRASAGFQFAGLAARLARALHDPTYQDTNDWVTEGRARFEQAACDDIFNVAAFDRVARELSIRMSRMRQTVPPNYRPAPAYRDDNAMLWDTRGTTPEEEADVALVEVELRRDAPAPTALELSGLDLRRRFRYPEWDCKLKAVREDWATVVEPLSPQRQGARAQQGASLRRLRIRGLERTPDRSIRIARLAEGDDLDLNAVIDNAVQRRSNVAPDGRLFIRHGRRRRTTAIVLLMDLSVSTNRFVPGSFTTVLDVEKTAAAVVAQALDQRRDRVAIHGFQSNGRHEVNYVRLKDFDESFDDAQRRRIESCKGELSTRMGAALRHASAALDAESTDHKVILMMTDGEPSDIDVVEDDYLVEDARHAVVDAAARGIRTFCLTLDRRADAYVRRIFGVRNYLIASRADTFAGWTGMTLVRLAAH